MTARSPAGLRARPAHSGTATLARRRPSGEPPPLEHHLLAAGTGWLAALIVVVTASAAVFHSALDGLAVKVTVADGAIARWLMAIQIPGLAGLARAAADASAVPVTLVTVYGLLVALLVLRRFRQLLVFAVSVELLSVLIQILQGMAQRPRPFGVPTRFGWAGFAFPSIQLAIGCAALVGVVLTLTPGGRWRRQAVRTAAAVIAVIGWAQIYLGVDAPSDALTGAVLGIAVPLVALRLFAPEIVFPITYRHGPHAHLDLGGNRGDAIRRAVSEQLGMVVTEIRPFGLAGSGGSTPMRLRVEGQPDSYLFGKLYARSHLRADRWYKIGRELLYGRLEDERPFSGVRRLVEQEDYALHLMRDAGLPSPQPYGFAELTPDQEYVLITEFFDGAAELGTAVVDDQVIDDGLAIIRGLWDSGLAHRDIKPSNLLVRDGRLLLIDVAFAEVRPSPWRQAVDLANMMLCLALRTSPGRVYQRALRQFTSDEIAEAFAAARGMALPSQLRHAIRGTGRDLPGEFLSLLPRRPAPVKIQRWNARRIWLLTGTIAITLLLAVTLPRLVISNEATASALPVSNLRCDSLGPLVLEAQSVPSASLVPCVRSLPAGWTFAGATSRNGRSVITLDNDLAGPGALELILGDRCAPDGNSGWHEVFPGGCLTIRMHVPAAAAAIEPVLSRQAQVIVGNVTRVALQQALDQRSAGRLRLSPGATATAG